MGRTPWDNVFRYEQPEPRYGDPTVKHDDEYASQSEPLRYELFEKIQRRKCSELSEAQCIYWDDDAVWKALIESDENWLYDLNRINAGDATNYFINAMEEGK